jgi:hypothetical protein
MPPVAPGGTEFDIPNGPDTEGIGKESREGRTAPADEARRGTNGVVGGANDVAKGGGPRGDETWSGPADNGSADADARPPPECSVGTGAAVSQNLVTLFDQTLSFEDEGEPWENRVREAADRDGESLVTLGPAPPEELEGFAERLRQVAETVACACTVIHTVDVPVKEGGEGKGAGKGGGRGGGGEGRKGAGGEGGEDKGAGVGQSGGMGEGEGKGVGLGDEKGKEVGPGGNAEDGGATAGKEQGVGVGRDAGIEVGRDSAPLGIEVGRSAAPPGTASSPILRTMYCMVRKHPAQGHHLDLRVAVVGNVDAGKSTLVGVLTGPVAFLDDGRGLARSRVLRHKHEAETGRTSSIAEDQHMRLRCASGFLVVFFGILIPPHNPEPKPSWLFGRRPNI